MQKNQSCGTNSKNTGKCPAFQAMGIWLVMLIAASVALGISASRATGSGLSGENFSWSNPGITGWSNPGKTGGDKLKGAFSSQKQLTASRNAPAHCLVDSGAGHLLYLWQDFKNELYPGATGSRMHLRIHFADLPQTGERISIPGSGITVCYQDIGNNQLLMYECFEGLGWLKFDKIDKSKVGGSLDLKLIKPHHNMSTSDYHYMGGKFSVNVAK